MSEVKRFSEGRFSGFGTEHPQGCWVRAAAFDRVTAERDAALGREAVLKEVTCFKDAVACVFDNLKMAACNTDDRAWDDRLEDLAEDVIEMATEYKKQWKDICRLTAENHELQQRLTAADERVDEAATLLGIWQTWLGSTRESCDEAGKRIWDRVDAVTVFKP